MPGTLYLCATPIGNLGDMTPRVVETLQTVDVIAAEDTRNSIKLLNHFDIHTPMTSYHEYNKVEKAHQLVGQLDRILHWSLMPVPRRSPIPVKYWCGCARSRAFPSLLCRVRQHALRR